MTAQKPRSTRPRAQRLATKREIDRAIEVAQARGLRVTGIHVEPGPVIRVETAPAQDTGADAALAAWQRGRRGAG